jgi:hypothetical protein
VAGMGLLHQLAGGLLGEEADDSEVLVGVEPGGAARRAAGPAPVLTAAYAAAVRALIAVITALNEQVKVLEEQVEEHFGRHPDAEIILSQPGVGLILGARVLAEFGDDPRRYRDGKARRNYAATSPLTRESGKKKVVIARFVHNDRLVDALSASPGARALMPPGQVHPGRHADEPDSWKPAWSLSRRGLTTRSTSTDGST